MRNGNLMVALGLIALLGTVAAIPAEAQQITAYAETTSSGTVSGSFVDTHGADAIYEGITEIQTGGKPSRRKSLLDHKWAFQVSAGTSVTCFVKAKKSTSSDGDDFQLWWSTDDVNFTPLLLVTRTLDDGTYQSAPLPASTQGLVIIRATDTNRVGGNTGLDTLWVDHLYIEAISTPMPPTAPSSLRADPSSSSSIMIGWLDNANDETGFRIERRPEGGAWSTLTSVPADTTVYEDIGLPTETTWRYRVYAFNSVGESVASNGAGATTLPAGSYDLEVVSYGVGIDTRAMGHDWFGSTAGIGFAASGAFFAERDPTTGIWATEAVEAIDAEGLDMAYGPGGAPALAYGRDDLRYAEKVGGSWSIETIASSVYSRKSVAFDAAGTPHIAYRRYGGGAKKAGLKLARRLGGTWFIENVAQQAEATWSDIAFDPLSDHPAIAYSDGLTASGFPASVMLARWNGAFWDYEIADSGGLDVSLAFHPVPSGGHPAIAHILLDEDYGVYDHELRFAWRDTAGWHAETIAIGRIYDCDLVIDAQGTPWVTYLTSGPPNELWLGHPEGGAWIWESINYWNAGQPAMALDPNGVPSIAHGGRLAFLGLMFAEKPGS